MDLTVSEAVSKYFYEQCAGVHNGHMSHIPNNPVIQGLLLSHGVNNEDDFARFLRQVADNLQKEQPF